MHTNLLTVTEKYQVENYNLKELALYFEKYDGYVCVIETMSELITFKIEKSSLPHMIGMHYAYYNIKDQDDYKGLKGFEKLKNGRITVEELRSRVKKNTTAPISWKNVRSRIEYLPMFFNTVELKSTRFKRFDGEKATRNTKLNPDYILFKIIKENKESYPCLTLKKVTEHKTVIQTFIIEKDLSIIGLLEAHEVVDIKMIPPRESVDPVITLRKIID